MYMTAQFIILYDIRCIFIEVRAAETSCLDVNQNFLLEKLGI